MLTPFERYAVLGPTLILSAVLSNLGVPPLQRLGYSVAFGALMILAVARFMRRRMASGRP